jgi:hypothetical protein
MRTLLTLFLIAGCTPMGWSIDNSRKYPDWNCEMISHSLQRCENEEVICIKYIPMSRGSGISCKWKQK